MAFTPVCEEVDALTVLRGEKRDEVMVPLEVESVCEVLATEEEFVNDCEELITLVDPELDWATPVELLVAKLVLLVFAADCDERGPVVTYRLDVFELLCGIMELGIVLLLE